MTKYLTDLTSVVPNYGGCGYDYRCVDGCDVRCVGCSGGGVFVPGGVGGFGGRYRLGGSNVYLGLRVITA